VQAEAAARLAAKDGQLLLAMVRATVLFAWLQTPPDAKLSWMQLNVLDKRPR